MGWWLPLLTRTHRNVVWLAGGGAHRRSSSRGQEWNTIFSSTSRSMKGRNQSPGDQFVGNRLDMIPATLRRGASRSRRGLAYLTTPVLELRPASCCEPCSACATGLRSGAPLTRTLRSRPVTCVVIRKREFAMPEKLAANFEPTDDGGTSPRYRGPPWSNEVSAGAVSA